MKNAVARISMAFVLCGVVGSFASRTVLAQAESAATGPMEVLTNADVVQMVAGKVPKAVILAKIQSTRPALDVTADALVSLHDNKVPSDVMAAMMKAAASQPSTEVLTNETVIHMVVGKLPRGLILDKIDATPGGFDLTAAGLVGLSQNGVSQDVVKEMMAAVAAASRPMPPAQPSASSPPAASPRSAAPAPAPVLPAPDASRGMSSTPTSAKGAASAPARGGNVAPAAASVRSPKTQVAAAKVPTEPGIYLYANSGKGPVFLLLEPTVYTATKTGGAFASAMTAGIAKVSLKASVRGAQASIGTADASAEFYFVFENRSAGLSNPSAMWGSVSSPNEFSLIRFDVKPSTREVVVGQANAFGAQAGTEDKANVSFTSTRLAPGIYRVVPAAPLADGQYAFMVGGSATGTAEGNRLFDFGVGR